MNNVVNLRDQRNVASSKVQRLLEEEHVSVSVLEDIFGKGSSVNPEDLNQTENIFECRWANKYWYSERLFEEKGSLVEIFANEGRLKELRWLKEHGADFLSTNCGSEKNWTLLHETLYNTRHILEDGDTDDDVNSDGYSWDEKDSEGGGIMYGDPVAVGKQKKFKLRTKQVFRILQFLLKKAGLDTFVNLKCGSPALTPAMILAENCESPFSCLAFLMLLKKYGADFQLDCGDDESAVEPLTIRVAKTLGTSGSGVVRWLVTPDTEGGGGCDPKAVYKGRTWEEWAAECDSDSEFNGSFSPDSYDHSAWGSASDVSYGFRSGSDD